MQYIRCWLSVSFFALSVLGQSNLGSIVGTVVDPSGAVLPNVTVTIRNLATDSLSKVGTSATGNFSVAAPGGTYELMVAVPGFKTFVQSGIPVFDGAPTQRDIRLEVGPVTEIVTVIDSRQTLMTQSGDIIYSIQGDLVNQLPVLTTAGGGVAGPLPTGNILNPLSALSLAPGITQASNQTLVINGLTSNSQTILVEGQDAQPTLYKPITDRSQVSIDAVETITVLASNYAAESGKAGGGLVEFTMKSGTNQFHGSASDYWVNEFMNAGTPFTKWSDVGAQYAYKGNDHVRNRQRRHDFSFNLGGPVELPKFYDGRDKTFFFFNLEQFREDYQTSLSTATVPTEAYRGGNFSAAGCLSFDAVAGKCLVRIPLILAGKPATDPASTPLSLGEIFDPRSNYTSNGALVRLPFMNQQISLDRLDPVAVAVQDLFPHPTNQATTNNYAVPPYFNFRHTTVPSIKLDHNFGTRLKLSGYWGQTITSMPNSNGFDPKAYPWTSPQDWDFRNNTVRINLDDTLTPTILLHVGVGYYHQRESLRATPFDQTKLGLPGKGQPGALPATDVFPTMFGLIGTGGGFSPVIGAPYDATTFEEKPTANLNLTWVKNNHTMKFGGEMTLSGYPTHNKLRATGNFVFNPAETGDPWQFGAFGSSPTGLNYASFLLGTPDSFDLGFDTSTRLGNKALGFFAQDTWRIRPNLTLQYGLRYDFQTYLTEQHGRFGSASFTAYNPTVGLPGAVLYEATCGCKLSSNYPFAVGPRVSAAYRITPRTVLRAGFGLTYGLVQTPNNVTSSVADTYSIRSPGYGLTPLPNGLQGGIPYYPGNPYGNPALTWPNFDPGKYPIPVLGTLPPVSPPNFYNPGSRPGRIAQWSVSLQRELFRNLVLEAAYVGNRGAWLYAPLLNDQAYNALTGDQLARYGLNINSATDRALLVAPLGKNAAAAAAHGIYSPYPLFPDTQAVGQAIRPIPQWNSLTPYLGPPNGNTWYDALQLQATQRYSHNLDMSVNFTYSHAMVNGVSQDTDYLLPGRPIVVDPFNRANGKQLNQLTSPLKTVIYGTYTTPPLFPWMRTGRGGRIASRIAQDWQLSAVLQYQSGALIAVPGPPSSLPIALQLSGPYAGTPFSNTPNYNPWNTAPGGFFRAGFDPNGSFDPRAYNPSNPWASSVLAGGYAANGTCSFASCKWTAPADGTWGATSPFLEGFRWRRQPAESVAVGRLFRFGADQRFVLNVRAECRNVMNRLFYGAPQTIGTTPSGQTITPASSPAFSSIFGLTGYGTINTFNGAGSQPRQGTVVVRLTF